MESENDAEQADSLSPLHRALVEMLGQQQNSGPRAPEDYRYVIYVRKSTDDPKKQPQSLGDQLTACKALAEQNNLFVARIYTESVSAKVSGMRPVFKEMIEAIVEGKYDGIIAWAPDRLARNMREGGALIDLMDDKTIKDLRLVTLPFVNSGDGKMILGLNFVLAKQWVDTHSASVKRSVDQRTVEGVLLGKAKHNYYKNGYGHLQPDAENWTLIKGAFERRLESPSHSLKDIAEWLKREGYPLKTVNGQRPRVKVNVTFVSKLLQETTYVGLLIYGDKIVDLRKLCPDFLPLISEKDFSRMTGVEGVKKYLKATQGLKKDGIKANLLRGLVICEDCGESLGPSITTKPKQRKEYFYFRCDTPGCPNRMVNLKAKTIVDFTVAFLASHSIASPEGYDSFVKEMKRLSVLKKEEINNRIRGLEQRKRGIMGRIEQMKGVIADDTIKKTIRKMYEPDLKNYRIELKQVESDLRVIRETKDALASNIVTYDHFVELAQDLVKKLQLGLTMKELDFILRKLFSNFYAKGKKVTKVTQNSPFRELCGSQDSAMVTPQGVEPWFQA